MPLLYRPEVEQARRTLSVQLTETAYKGWDQFCMDEGVSLTAFHEVMGQEMATRHYPPYTAEAFGELVQVARRITAEHRRRRRV